MPVKTDIEKKEAIQDLRRIPGVGVSIANDFWNIGIKSVAELKGKDPQVIYEISNAYAGVVQDRCLLYVFREAVYFAETPEKDREPELLKWWNWMDDKMPKGKKKFSSKNH